jgi:hypothetical protein
MARIVHIALKVDDLEKTLGPIQETRSKVAMNFSIDHLHIGT